MDNTVADLDSVPLLRTTSDLPKQPLYVPLSRSELPLRVPMPYQYMPQQEPQISGHDRAVQAVNEDHLGFFSVGMMVALAICKDCNLSVHPENCSVEFGCSQYDKVLAVLKRKWEMGLHRN